MRSRSSVSSRFRQCWCATPAKAVAIGLCCCSPVHALSARSMASFKARGLLGWSRRSGQWSPFVAGWPCRNLDFWTPLFPSIRNRRMLLNPVSRGARLAPATCGRKDFADEAFYVEDYRPPAQKARQIHSLRRSRLSNEGSERRGCEAHRRPLRISRRTNLQQIDDLVDAKRLVRDDSRYVLPPRKARRPSA
jgi:hypothetical protein